MFWLTQDRIVQLATLIFCFVYLYNWIILGMGLGRGYLLARVGDKRGKWFVGRLVNTFVFITFFHGLDGDQILGLS